MPTFRERFEWVLRMALLVFILAAAAFLSAVTTMRLAIQGREVEMPNLVGKKVAEAQLILGTRKISLRVADRVYSDLPAESIVRQSPPAGEHVKIHQAAHVVLSLGPHRVAIPLLEGQSLRAARIELLRSSLQVGEVSSPYLPGQPADTVIIQSPKPGTGAPSPRVDLLVSQGAREPAFVMPFLIGQNEADAQKLLSSAGLRIAHLSTSTAPQWPRGAVIEQAPPAGARVAPSTSIEIKVAD